MNERNRILLRTVPFLAIGLLVFVAYLVLFVNIDEMIQVIRNTDLIIYSSSAVMLFIGTIFFTLTWQYLLFPLSVRISMKKAFAFVLVGVFADLVIPAESVSGEIVRTYLVSNEPDVNPGKVVASLVGQRIMGTVTTTVTLFISFLGLLALDFAISGLMLQILAVITILSAFAFVFLMVLCVKEKWTERLVIKLMHFIGKISRGRLKLERFQARIIDAMRAFYESMRVFSSKPKTLVLPAVFNVSSWISSFLVVFLVFISIGYLEANLTVFLLKIAVVYTLLVAIKSIPLGVPAEVGLPEIIMTTMFTLLGIPPSISAAATFLTRILTVWVNLFVGFAAVQWLGVTSLMRSGIFGKAKNQI
ncbi:MAG: flippase-like domain-containing protein [Candidatus Bathyarchaeota archaeon]|nr:flippase-like domain-containing protein [Candidatus Bathyarchaeota archaeon]